MNKHGKLNVLRVQGADCDPDASRSVSALLAADAKLDIPDFCTVFVRTGESCPDPVQAIATVSLAHAAPPGDDLGLAVPAPTFDLVSPDRANLFETGKAIAALGSVPAQSDLMGWGGVSSPAEHLSAGNVCDTASHGRSVFDKVRDYAFLLMPVADDHLKLMLFSKRILFVIDDGGPRPFFFEFMTPWKHYVPVSPDLSDLAVNFERLKQQAYLRHAIIANMRFLVMRHITPDAAADRWRSVLEKVARAQPSDALIPAITTYTVPNYQVLHQRWLQSMPAGFEPITFSVAQSDIASTQSDQGDFQSDMWYKIIKKKVLTSVECLNAFPDGKIVLCSDSDVVFVDDAGALAGLARAAFDADPLMDVWWMAENGGVNGGFYFVRNSQKVRDFLVRGAEHCDVKSPVADQDYFNQNRHAVNSGFIPNQYVAKGDDLPGSCALVYHAIGASGVQAKMLQYGRAMARIARVKQGLPCHDIPRPSRARTFHMPSRPARPVRPSKSHRRRSVFGHVQVQQAAN